MPAAFSVRTRDSVATVTVPVPRADRYQVLVYPLGQPEGAPLEVWLLGQPVATVPTASTEIASVLDPVLLGSVAASDSVRVFVEPPVPQLAAVHPLPIRNWATTWSVVGPFANPQRLGTEHSPAVDSSFGPERGSSGPYEGLDGVMVGWMPAEAGPDGQVRLRRYFGVTDWVAAYGRTYLHSPRAQDATLLLGADDAHQIWLNGELVSSRQGRNISRPDDVVIPVRLRDGWNVVLVKVANLDGGWAFQLRVADVDGALRWSARPEN